MKSVILRNNSPMRSLFEDFLNEDFFSLGKSNIPSVNVKEEESEFLVEVAAPGYKKDSFNIEVKDSYLTISSKNESNKEEKNDKYHRREFYSSSFERSFSLPKGVNADEIKASYNDGILSVSIPKQTKVENKSRMIEIQ